MVLYQIKETRMTNLKDVNFGMNTFCGPAVLSVLTGENTDKCAAVISAITGQREIRAVQRGHLKEAFRRLRFDVQVSPLSGSTLYGTLFKLRIVNGLYVVFVPHHVVAVEVNGQEMFICDNHSKVPLDVKQSARLMQKVEEVWMVRRRAEPKFIRSEIMISRGFHETTITQVDVYENPDDNVSMPLGHIRVSSRMMYHEIVKKLMEAEND
jgi:hypothetical protein